MFKYEFMRNAIYAGILLSIIMPLIGLVVVNRRTSNIGDALSHTSLAGISLGLILGFNPIIGSIIACLLASLAIDGIRKKLPVNGDMATVIVMTTGIGIASILSDYLPGSQNMESFLFGSIITVTSKDNIIMSIVAIFVIIVFIKNYWAILHITVDKTQAKLSGVNVDLTNYLFTIVMTLTIAVASKTVGALMVSSLLVIPIASGMIFAKSYKSLVLFSILFAIMDVLIAISLSYYLSLKPGGLIAIVSVFSLFLAYVFSNILSSKELNLK